MSKYLRLHVQLVGKFRKYCYIQKLFLHNLSCNEIPFFPVRALKERNNTAEMQEDLANLSSLTSAKFNQVKCVSCVLDQHTNTADRMY